MISRNLLIQDGVCLLPRLAILMDCWKGRCAVCHLATLRKCGRRLVCALMPGRKWQLLTNATVITYGASS